MHLYMFKLSMIRYTDKKILSPRQHHVWTLWKQQSADYVRARGINVSSKEE